MLLILSMYALFASTFILGREVVSIVPPIFFIGIRMLLAGSMLFTYIWSVHREQIKCKRAELPWFLGIVFFHIYAAYVLEYISLQYLTGAKVSLLYNLSPFITGLLAYFLMKEKMTFQRWLGLAIGFFAFLPLLINQYITTSNPLVEQTFEYAEIILLISITSSCIGWIFMKKLTHYHDHSYLFVNTVGMLGGGVLALATSWYTEQWPCIHDIVYNLPFIRGLFGLIIIGNIICYNLYGYLLHRYSTTFLSFCGFFTPLFAALFGWIWLGETIELSFIVTVLLVTVGLYIFYKEDLKLGYSIKK